MAWLDELTERWGPPPVAFPRQADPGDRVHRGWSWFPGRRNHSVTVDTLPGGRHVVSVSGFGARADVTFFQAAAPSDEQVRRVLAAAGWLS